jgi:hypothetical protein
MVHKLASSTKLDMMFDLRNDRFEVNNLLLATNTEADYSTDIDESIVAKAEHLRCLLLDWMIRLDPIDGSENDGTDATPNTTATMKGGYFSDPVNNYGEA